MTDPGTALRDLLTGHLRGHGRRLRRFTDDDWRRYADLLHGAFGLAVRRRFEAGQDRAPVIRFVASVRERHDRTGHDVDPVAAEALVWAALGERPAVPVTAPVVTALTVLLVGLLADEGVPVAELTGLLAAAGQVTRPVTDEPPADDGAADQPSPDGPAA